MASAEVALRFKVGPLNETKNFCLNDIFVGLHLLAGHRFEVRRFVKECVRANICRNQICFAREAYCATVLGVYNQQRSVLGFWNERSGLGVVWAVPMNFPPSKVPDTTLVPCQMARMVAGNCHSHVSMGPQLPPVTPPSTGTAR